MKKRLVLTVSHTQSPQHSSHIHYHRKINDYKICFKLSTASNNLLAKDNYTHPCEIRFIEAASYACAVT